MNILWAVDKLTLDGRSPTCIAMNLRDAYRGFAERGVRITVCDLRDRDPGAELLRAAGLPVIETGVPSASPRTLPALLRAARAGRADLIHAHGYSAANYGRIAGRLLKIPVVVHEHAILRVRPHQYLFDRLTRRWTTRGVAISRAVARFMVRGRSVPPDRIEIIPNGIDLSRFREAARLTRAEARAAFGWPAEVPIVGSAARFRREKGLEALFEAARRLAPRFPGLLCVMAGDGDDREGLLERAAAEGLEDRVLFPGFVEDIPRFMRALDLLVIPSLQEGLSYSAMEAMAASTPVVASRAGGLPELIEDGVTGALCTPGDPGALAEAIAGLLENRARRKELSGNASRAVEVYGLDHYVERMSALYRKLVDERPEGGLK